MNLKELGMRFGLAYLLSRSTGKSREEAALESGVASVIAQSVEDVSGVTAEMGEVTNAVVGDLLTARRTQRDGFLTVRPNMPKYPVSSVERNQIENEITNPDVGLEITEMENEVQELTDGVMDSYRAVLNLDRLKAGVLKRNQ